ncbi:MAG TPA: DUF1444 family protein [Xanthobacteraceae bacterium]|nr:DUF1444 family protein [Xanthobacteraceae bacterium]
MDSVVYRFMAALFACVLFTGHAVAENLNPAAFTAAFATAASAAMPDAKVSVAADLHLETRGKAGGTTDTDLHNAYQAYLGAPGQLDAVIRRYVGLLVDTVRLGGVAPPVDRSHILPVLKPNSWAAAIIEQRKSAPATMLLTEPFNNELTIVYVEDHPSSIRYLMTRDDVGDRTKLHDLALANLQRLLPKIEMATVADGVFLISAGGDYDPSLLLDDGIWSSGQIKVAGDIVAAVPAKNALVVTGSRNAAGLTKLRALVADLARGPYAVTPALFVYRGGKFIAFDGK